MAWDQRTRGRYEQEVLAAARRDGVPADLFERYGIDVELSARLRMDGAAFAAHTHEVCAYWRGLMGTRRALRQVLSEMVAAHERLSSEGALTHAHFLRVREERTRQGRDEWESTVRGLTTEVMDREALDELLRWAPVSEEEAVGDLRTHGVQVVDRLPDLPTAPPIRDTRALSEHLRTRGVPFSPTVVFGEERLAAGFSVLDGFRLRSTDPGSGDGGGAETTLSDAALDAAGRRIQVEAMTESKVAAERVVALLRTARSPELRGRIALWEILEHLSSRPAVLSERALVQPWVALGLDGHEAALIAASVRRGEAGMDRGARVEWEVRELLTGHRLRQAQAAAAELPADHELRARVDEAAERVSDLVRRAEAALLDRRPEDAALELSSAVELAADDTELAARLGAVAPAPPGGAAARVDGRRVVVTWQPSTSLAGRVTYRVARLAGRGGTARERPLAEVSGTEAVDDDVPVGSEVRYSVVAVRGGRGVSSAVSSRPVMITPDVTELRVRSGESSVSGSWRPPPEAVRVEVLRAEGNPPRGLGDGVPVENDGTGFRDTAVRPDVEYYYRVRAMYLTSQGWTRGAEGLVRRANPGSAPAPVQDLVVESEAEGFVASWTAPTRGRVLLFTADRPPPWPPGETVPADRWSALGTEVPSEAVTGPDGRSRAQLPLPSGVTYVVAVTVTGDQAVAGERVRVTAAPPVTDLRAERFDTAVRLSWTWPDQAVTAVVSWREDTGTDGSPAGAGASGGPDGYGGTGEAGGSGGTRPYGEARRSRTRYAAEGGFEAHMGSGPVLVTVRTAVASDSGESLSGPATVPVPGKAVLDYRVETVGLLRRERIVRVGAEAACDMPEVAVVYAPGRIQPGSVEQGRVLATFPARRLSAGEWVSVRVQPPRERGPAWLMCFPAGESAGVRLRQPSVKELRL
ncbi:hypothetical protein [Nocardiopsis oceani]